MQQELERSNAELTREMEVAEARQAEMRSQLQRAEQARFEAAVRMQTAEARAMREAEEAVQAEDAAAMKEAEAVVERMEQQEEAKRHEAVQRWEEQTVDCIQHNWVRVRELSAEWRGSCRQLVLHKEKAITARQNWLQLADGRFKAHKQLRREIAALDLLHRSEEPSCRERVFTFV